MDFILTIISNMTASDLLDMCIVAYIIYHFLFNVQGTRAVQMLFGILTLGTLYWLSLTYELYSLNWILNHFFDYFFIVLIIIFQDQIRNALVSFGDTRLFEKKKKDTYEQQVEEVLTACHALSRERTGALIVFEKNLGLLNYRLSGTTIDANIHSDLLYALFQTNSPLHDGAIILHEEKIAAAGCFLPLSKNIEIDKHLGTRHRAALGISEVSDAVVLVVSEETGRISYCYGGRFFQPNTEIELRKHLLEVLRQENVTDIKLINLKGAS
jgi:diadenylate cyclase